jgi:hypothetical protein
MKKITLMLISAGLLGLSSQVNAAGLTSGDLYLGFDNPNSGTTGAFKSVVIDLGSISSLAGTTTLDLSSALSPLQTVFGAGWGTNANIDYAAFGAISSSNMVIGASAGNGALVNSPYNYISSISRSAINNSASAMVSIMNGAGFTTTNWTSGSKTFGVSYDSATTLSAFVNNSFGDQMDGNNATFNLNYASGAINNALGSPLSGNYVNLWNYTNNASQNWLTNSMIGTITETSLGVFTINVSAVPEPSDFGFMALALALIGGSVCYRRFVTSKQNA